MRMASGTSLLLCVIVLVGVGTPCAAQGPLFQSQGAAVHPPSPAKDKSKTKPADSSSDSQDQDDVPDEDLAPAAVQLDVSNSSPLIQELYQATRETKEKEILARLDTVKKLIDTADLNATDPQGRTALHWAVFGSSYNIKPSVLVAYEEIADTLIGRGVDINKQDVYQDTALDYVLYAPTFEIQTLLLEHGASSGFLAAFYNFFNQMAEGVPQTHAAAVAQSRRADLAPGATLSLRLDVPVYSDRSRTGDPIEATVTYPLCRNGEQVACKDGELLVPPGSKVNGTVLFAQKAPDKYSRPRLVLDFSNILHKNASVPRSMRGF
jgi:Ankyrin repeat